VKAEEAAKAEEQAQREKAALARRKTKWDCAAGHGLARFVTPHPSFCCDVCRCYLPQGSSMWGCRKCDWDVCETRCRPKGSYSFADLNATTTSLESRFADVGNSEDVKATLAQIESEVHHFEKALDGLDLEALAKSADKPMTVEEARLVRKQMLQHTENFLVQIEEKFTEVKAGSNPEGVQPGAESK
jgi:hypothetical protein